MTTTLGRNYARALFDLARETSSLDAVEQDLHSVCQALHADLDVRAFLANRLIGRAAKKSLFRDFKGKTDERVLTLLLLLVDRGRTRLLGEIAEEFDRLSRLARGVRKVKVFSAFPPRGGGEDADHPRAGSAACRSRGAGNGDPPLPHRGRGGGKRRPGDRVQHRGPLERAGNARPRRQRHIEECHAHQS